MRALVVPDVPILSVQPLLGWGGTVVQWRSSHGVIDTLTPMGRPFRKKRRFCWAAKEAADLAGVPTRTLYDWVAARLVEPTVWMPAFGVEAPGWGNGDVLAITMIADLRAAGFDRRVQELVAQSVQTLWAMCDYAVDELDGALLEQLIEIGRVPENRSDRRGHHLWEGRQLSEFSAIWGDRLLLPADVATAELLMDEFREALVWVGGEADSTCVCERTRDGEVLHVSPLCPYPDLPLIEYPLAERVATLEERIGRWWERVYPRPPVEARPSWLT